VIQLWCVKSTSLHCQGQTIKKTARLVADIGSIFGPGMAYVIFGRVQELDQLYLETFNAAKLTVSNPSLSETELMSEEAKISTEIELSNQTLGGMVFTTLNIVSLQKHHLDLKGDIFLLSSDILCLSETRFTENTNLASFDIDGYKLQATLGPGQGVAIYFKNDLVKICHEMIVQSTYQILKVVFRDFDVLAVYRSPTSNTDHFLTSLTRQK
jgi:hypothetical protein